ncbi:MAG TPA: hypothetical protein V6D47_19410 [Oscillatoriaceae cyanobacterium]
MPRAHAASKRLIVSAIALLLASCASSPASLTVRRTLPAKPAAKPGPQLLAPEEVKAPAFVATTGGANLSGTVGFQAVTNSFFADNAANYRVASMPSAHAILTLSTLDENLLSYNGSAITTTADGNGRYTLTGVAPSDRAYVVTATLVQSHQLSALVPKGAASATIDEGSSMITEMARWQMRDVPVSNDPYASETTLADLTPATLNKLYQNTLSVLNPADFAPSSGAIPSIDALKIGAGHVLRNRYVTAFGAKVTSNPASTAAPDVLSDTWKSLLGFRPLALTRLAGSGVQGASGNQEGADPVNVQLTTPIDAVADGNGDVYLSEQDSALLRYIPASTPGTAPYGYNGSMQQGKSYTIAGAIGGPSTLTDFDNYFNATQDNTGGLPAGSFIYSPYRIALGTGSTPDIYFTSNFGSRVMMIPGSNEMLFGRPLNAGEIYTIAGSGALPNSTSAYVIPNPPATPIEYPAPIEDPSYVDNSGYWGQAGVGFRFQYNLGDGGPAYAANVSYPTGLVRDGSGNLLFLDTHVVSTSALSNGMDYASATVDPTATSYSASAAPGRYYLNYHGTIRIVRASDGTIFSLKLLWNGAPLPLDNANDLRISPDGQWLYVADTGDDVVLKVPMPSASTIAGWSSDPTPVDVANDVVLGSLRQPGFINTANGVLYPEIYDVSQGMDPAQALLNNPTSIDFDPQGNLVVADSGNGRIRVLATNGLLYTIAGGLDTTYLSGDARLAYFGQLGYLNLMPGGLPNFLVVDSKENVVDTLWTGRGTL